MKYFVRTFLLIIPLVFMAPLVLAQTMTSEAELRVAVSDLRTYHAELKAQVDAGTLSAAEAREMWRSAIARVRAMKQAYFDARVQTIAERLRTLPVEQPSRTATLEARIEATRERRAATEVERAEITARMNAGEIQKEAAHEMRMRLLENQQREIRALRNTLISNEVPNAASTINLRLDGQASAGAVLPANAARPNVNTGFDFQIHQDLLRPITGAGVNANAGLVNDRQAEVSGTMGIDARNVSNLPY